MKNVVKIFAEQAINPFSTESLIICALDWLKAHPHRVQQAIEAEFDCLIVDEAHHLAWSENAPSATYLLVEQLANAIPSVLLLTATPEQLGLESHFARLRLLDPERFYDYQAFLKEQENYQPVADAVQSLLSEKPLRCGRKNHISDLLNEQDVEPLFKALACHNDEGEASGTTRTHSKSHRQTWYKPYFISQYTPRCKGFPIGFITSND